MAPVADEFFGRLRGAGLRVGLTVRPQELERFQKLCSCVFPQTAYFVGSFLQEVAT
jgi:hypothetical protein